MELENLDLDLGTTFICASWYGTLATMLMEADIQIEKIRIFDIDDSCWTIADTVNRNYVLEGWRVKSQTLDIHDIDCLGTTYITKRADESTCELYDIPKTIINTSCEHIVDFDKWYATVPKGILLILQSNDYFGIEDHINCVKDINAFKEQCPMSEYLYEGTLDLHNYNRFMLIGKR